MRSIDPSELLKQMAAKERKFRAQDFVAPYTQGSVFAIVPMHKGMLYRFRIKGFKDAGIGLFHPTSPNDAEFVSDAPFDQARTYLDALPKTLLVLSYQTEQGWIALPLSEESTRKTLGIAGPVLVLNVSDAQRFDPIVARFDGVNFWFDELFTGADPVKADEMRALFQKGFQGNVNVKGVVPEERDAYSLACDAWKQFAKISVESKVKQILKDGGARLGSFVVRGKNIEIKWTSASGEVYNSLVNKDTLDVISAGICLSGEDSKFHLKDLPHLIEQGEKRRLIVITRHARN
jgi:hypothetical protein